MVSIFNCQRCSWKTLQTAALSPSPTADRPLITPFHYGATLYPILDPYCDRVSRVLLLGGIDLLNPLAEQDWLNFTQVDLLTSFRNVESFGFGVKPLSN